MKAGLQKVFLILTLFWSATIFAQADPEGQLDYLDLVCGTDGYWGTGGNQVCFQVRLFSDNTGINRIQSVGLPLIIAGANIVAVDTTLATAFAGSVVGHFEILTVTKHGDPNPAVPPFHVTYGALSLSQLPSGNGTAINVCLTVNDTGSICIDTLSASESDFPILTTGAAVGYVPGWGGPAGQGYPDGEGICCQVELCAALAGDANADGSPGLSDVIATVNYVFCGSGDCSAANLGLQAPLKCFGWPPCPANSPLCWLSGLCCRGDWNGSGTITLSDVIWGVNYIFNRPYGPWDPVPLGECCRPVP
ncbi:MAG: hypothetical protein A2Z27_05745 [candidate division Zixibacteria bacterium RBG_16_50_21]|nr:MAG: hypothetical protein A2Z27_05745 [candidate division Zixibacteria bacterium RBG_16_50_21]